LQVANMVWLAFGRDPRTPMPTVMPDVSVIVPTFNRPQLLARALDSLAAQTLARDAFEVIVVNDCGLDPSATVERFTDRLDVRLVSTPENSGLAAARNVGIEHGAGRYLSFLDDDDCFYPEHLALLLATAEQRGGEVVVYSDAVRMVEDESGTPLLRHMIMAPATFSYQRLLLNNYIHAMSPLVPSSAIDAVGGFDESLRALEDWELWLRIGATHEFHHLLRVTADYRVRAGSVNNTTRELPLHVRCTERIYEQYPAGDDEALKRDRADYLEQHRRSAGEHAFRVSVAIVGADDVDQLRGAIDDATRTHGADDVELLAYVPDALAGEHRDELEQLERSRGGRLVFVGGAQLAPEAALAVLERKAAGRRVERLLVDATDTSTAPPSDEAADDDCIREG
jgi:glycosyltransferase involved in cell wall biosynthesis